MDNILAHTESLNDLGESFEQQINYVELKLKKLFENYEGKGLIRTYVDTFHTDWHFYKKKSRFFQTNCRIKQKFN